MRHLRPDPLGLQPVTHPRFVDDVAWVGRVVAKLLADLGDHVTGVVLVSDGVLAPNLAQQGGVRDRLAGMESEVSEQLVFRRRQVYGPAVDSD